MLNHEFPPVGGGAAGATSNIARELAVLGTGVTVMTTAYNGLPRMEVVDGYSVIRVPAWRREASESHPHEIASYLTSAFWKAFPRCFRSESDLVHAFFGVPSGAIGYALKRLTGFPYVVSFRGRDVHNGKGRDSNGISGPLRAISKIIWRHADALVANSQGLKQIALRVDPGIDVDVIPNGVDTTWFTPGPSAHSDRPLRLLFVGRLESYKGLTDLFEALRIVGTRTNRPFTLQVVGDGSLRNSLVDAAVKRGLADRISFRGAVPGAEMPDVYRDADLFILPSIVEGMPNAVLEAMASGLPVLATRIPGSEDLIEEGQTGFLVPPVDPQTLADRLYTLIENDKLRINTGRRARGEAENRSWRQIAKSYFDLYKRVLE